MPRPTRAAPYQAWLLRCWHEPGAAGPGGGWRFSLEDPHSGQRRGFASLERLVAALAHELAAMAPGPGETGDTSTCVRQAR
jgi:hypothetical protein